MLWSSPLAADAQSFEELVEESDALFAKGAWDRSLALLDKALPLAVAARSKPAEIDVRVRRALVFEKKLELIEQRDETARILKLEVALGRQTDAMISRIDLGMLETKLGNVSKAVALLERAAAFFAQAKEPLMHARVLVRLASAHHEVGQYAKALDGAERAAATFLKHGESREEAEALNEIGRIQMRLGNHGAARVTLEKAGGTAPQDAVELRLLIRCNQAVSSYEMGDIDAALNVLEDAARAFAKKGDKVALRRTWLQIGAARLRAGLFASAREALERVHDDESAPALDRARAHVYGGQAALAAGAPAEAQRHFSDGAKLAERVHSQTMASAAFAGLAHAQIELGKASSKEILKAVRRALDGVDEIVDGLPPLALSSARGHVDRASAFSAGARLALRDRDAELLYEMIERGRAGSLRIRAGMPIGAPVARTNERWRAAEAARERLIEARRRYDRSIRLRHAPRIEEAARLTAQAYSEYARSLDVLGLPAPGSGAKGEVLRLLPLKSLQSLLKPDEALVAYSLAGPAAGALVVTEKQSRVADLGPAKVLRTLVSPASKSEAGADEWLKAMPEIREELIKPLKLPESAQKVIIVPDGLLACVPLTLALPNRQSSFVPSTAQFVHLRNRSKRTGKGLLAFADPLFERFVNGRALAIHIGQYSPLGLDGTRGEAEEVAKGRDAVTRYGGDATETAFMEEAGKRPRWAEILIGTHGFPHLDDPGRSTLLLTPSDSDDGFLTVHEIMRAPPAADLVFLSACNSGRGTHARNEGLLGLPHAFLYGGSTRIVASLWKVDDEATEHLVKAFFKAWRSGQGAAEALQTAQASVKAEKNWRDEAAWAAWVIWGLPE